MKKRLTLQDKAEVAMKEAVRDVIGRAKKSGKPLYAWRHGKVVRISAKDL